MTPRSFKRWVEGGPLAPWMLRYAQWLAGQPSAQLSGGGGQYRSRYPTGEERAARCSEYSGRRVQRQLVMLVERRADFVDYFEKLRADAVFHAKELGTMQVAKNFALRDMGLDLAVEAKDHRSLEQFTRPYVDLAFPKKPEKTEALQRFTINLFGATEEQKKLILKAVTEEEPDEIEYEVIENEKLLTGGEDD